MGIFIIIVILKVIRFYSYLLFAYALLSWFPGASQSTIGRLIGELTEPIIKPFRRFNLQIGGLDFTIFAVMISLNLLSEVLIRLFS